MTATQISEALRAVADATTTPEHDRVAFQRLVRDERRRRTSARLGVAGAVAAAAAVVAATVVQPFGGDDDRRPEPARPLPVSSFDLQVPVYLVVDGGLAAIDTDGTLHESGIRAEEVIGFTEQGAWFVGGQSGVVEVTASWSAGGSDSWSSQPSDLVGGAVSSAQLSDDGRWLGWVDLQARLHVHDLETREDSVPVRLRDDGFLVDLAQGTGTPLVADDHGLLLLRPDNPQVLGTETTWAATAARDRVAVPYERRTFVYDTSGDEARFIGEVPGLGVLSPHGDRVASVSADEGDASRTARLAVPGSQAHALAVDGRPDTVSWADDDTVLVSSWLDGAVAVFACEATDADGGCTRLDVGTPRSLRFAR